MQQLIIGCNYHTTWQRIKGMRFVLKSISEDGLTCVLYTRKTEKEFTTSTDSLIFIDTSYNKDKAIKLSNKDSTCNSQH